MEVFQELLHRYSAIRRTGAVGPAFETLKSIVDEIFPVEMRDVEQARGILAGYPGLSARDSLHVSVMQRYEIRTVLSFGRGFDRAPGLASLPSD